MPVAICIAGAAFNYQINDMMVKQAAEGLTDEEWLRRPCGTSNHLLWIVCHMIWARGNTLGFLGSPWSKPWSSIFARGAKLTDSAEYPSPEEVMQAFGEVSGLLATALGEISDEELAEPTKLKVPNCDGKLSGVINFMAHHDTYHAGQVAYMRCWLGHSGVAG